MEVKGASETNAEPAAPAAPDTGGISVFPSSRLFPPSPDQVLPTMRGRYGLSAGRTMIATALLACSLGLMKLVADVTIGLAVIPLWAAAVGTLVDGLRGATRGIIFSVVYPAYCSLLVAIAFLVFWIYALTHRYVAGAEILW